jgi:hypothetical protein
MAKLMLSALADRPKIRQSELSGNSNHYQSWRLICEAFRM